jgi:hypothetical protein
MAIVVVGGCERGVGKTALVCGVLSALPEFAWIAVKVTAHGHAGDARIRGKKAGGIAKGIAEEIAGGKDTRETSAARGSAAEQGSDTARYLAAGARRAFLLTADDCELGERLSDLASSLGPRSNLIFESNRVLGHLRADLCLAIEPESGAARKASFVLVERAALAWMRRVGADGTEKLRPGPQPVFKLAEFERISAPMQHWLRAHLPRHCAS